MRFWVSDGSQVRYADRTFRAKRWNPWYMSNVSYMSGSLSESHLAIGVDDIEIDTRPPLSTIQEIQISQLADGIRNIKLAQKRRSTGCFLR